MATPRSAVWRILFIVAALCIMTGGPLHPGGTMAEMIGHPQWVLSHALMLAGFAALLLALFAFGRDTSAPESTRRWTRWAVIGAVAQVLEMVFHTAASVDHANLMAGRPTPILTAHLWLAVVCYPIFAVTIIGFIITTARDRSLGSRWIAWLGVLGAAAHGIAPVLVVALKIDSARVLFPMVMLLALWLVLAALWPVRERQLMTASPAAS